MTEHTAFDRVLFSLDERISRTLEFLPIDIKVACEEIRLREGLPVCLTVRGKPLFVCRDSTVTDCLSCKVIRAERQELYNSLLLICNHSVYAHENEIKNGYVSMSYGGRAGVCGVFNSDGMLSRVTSINIRIARQIYGCADILSQHFDGGMLIAGPPASGKTTILRDLIRQLSSKRNLKVAVIDSRGELSGGFDGERVNDLGTNTDVLHIQNKALGTQIALRTMFPDVIAFDEIGTESELKSVSDCFNAGVHIVTTAHCSDTREILCRSVTRALLEGGAISKTAFLSRPIGSNPRLISSKELLCVKYS